jgi:hypothetical protein
LDVKKYIKKKHSRILIRVMLPLKKDPTGNLVLYFMILV